jgi:hypothetical protein
VKGPGWLFDNLGLKLFALLLALLLYAHVLTDRTLERVVYFPLQINDLPDSLALGTVPPAEIGVKLRGTGKQILRLQYLRPTLPVSMAGVAPGTYQRTFAPGDVPLAGATDVSVLEIVDPPQLSIEVTRRARKRVPVVAALVGEPARGYVLSGPPDVRPPSVRLSGSEEWIAAQESLRTTPIAIAGRRDTLELMQALAPSPGWATATPGSVLVAVPIEPEAARQFPLDVEARGIRGDLRVDLRPPSVNVAWRGPRSRAGQAGPQTLHAVVHVGRRGRGEWTLPVHLEGDVTGAVATPESVTVIVR